MKVLASAGCALLVGWLAACVQASAATSMGSGSVDAAAMIAAHNEWRAKVGVPDLQWSDKLAAAAQKWADHLAASSCSLGHSGGEYGENIYWASSLIYSDGRRELSPKIARDAVNSWGNEVKWYDYADNSCHMECGHYTQVVWKNTKEVGCAMAVCSNKAQLWVCNYYPAGNMIGHKPY